MTTAPAYEKGKLYQIPITDLKPDPDQPRKVIDPEALAELDLVENLQRQDLTSVEEAGGIGPLPARRFRVCAKGGEENRQYRQ
jgi:hypothetical protein